MDVVETLFWITLGIAGGYALGSLVLAFKRKSSDRHLLEMTDARDFLDALVERCPMGFIVTDESMRIVRASDAYCRMTGRTKEDLIGRGAPMPGWAPEDRPMIENRIELIRRGDMAPFEVSYVLPDGGRIPLEFHPGSFRTKDGRMYYFGVVNDLTRRKDREAKLKESEATFRRIAETSTDAIYQLDLDGTVTYCSRAVERVLGYPPEEFIGTDFRAHFLPEDLAAAENAFVRSVNGEEIRNAELRILDKNKKPIFIEVNATPIWRDDRIVGSQGIARDVTERKSAEDVIHSSEARFRTVIENIPFDFFLIDENGRYTMENSTCRERWGKLIGKRPQDAGVDEKTLAIWLENNRRAFAGVLVEDEVSFTIDGEVKHFHNIISPVRDRGKIRGILGINIDITRRVRAEAALRESEEKYRFLVENSGTVVTMWDDEGRLMFINQMGVRIIGRTPEELVGKPFHDVVPMIVTDDDRTWVKRVLDSGVGLEREDEVELPLGKRWLRSFLQPVRDAEGRLFGVQVVSHDITELMQIERSLRDKDARLRLMVSQLPAVVWTVDRDLRFTSSAGAGLKALGLGPGEVVGMTLYEYFNTQDPEFLPIAMHRKSLQGEATTFEVIWDERVWETHTEPLRNDAGEIIGCLAIGLDVTKRKLAEEELKYSKEQLRALAASLHQIREEESTNIAREIHDELGQALTGIKLDLSFVQRRLFLCGDPDDRADLENKVKEMSADIDATVDAVRRISTKLRPRILDDLDLPGAIEWQTQDFQRRTSIACDFNQYGTASELQLDPPRSTAVFRILQEILTNVRRHAGATHVWVDLRREDESFLLEVRDNGKGFPRSQLNRLDGLGILGMSERAQVFGGHVRIDSEPGKGTSVKVTIPLGDSI